MLFQQVRDDGNTPTFNEELSKFAHDDPYFQKQLDDLILYERITGENWETALRAYGAKNMLYDLGMALKDFYEKVVLKRLEKPQ